MRSKNPRHAAVMEATLAAYDRGVRAGELIAVFVDAAHEQRAAANLSDLNTEFVTAVLFPASVGARDELEKALYGFNL